MGTKEPRRAFLKTAVYASFAASYLSSRAATEEKKMANSPTPHRPLIISTWPFGKPANEAALRAIGNGGTALDGVEQGIRFAEADPSNHSVGLAGLPNSAGVVQLDACIMNGPGHKAGSVGSLEGILHPISVARRVMEKTPHVMLVGAGALEFARKEGFAEISKLDERERKVIDNWKKTKGYTKGLEANHDTIALIVLAKDGTIAGGCSTSGLSGKLPGRVGDSPIIGSGLYVDDEVGGAGATGIGENVMRYCGSFMVVEYMRQGASPTEACIETIKRIAKKDPKGFDLSINFIALNKKGEFGAAGTGQGFQFSVTTPNFSGVLQSPGLTQASVGKIGGNQPGVK